MKSNALEKLFEDLKGFKHKRLKEPMAALMPSSEEPEMEEEEMEEPEEHKGPKMMISLTEIARFADKNKPSKKNKKKR